MQNVPRNVQQMSPRHSAGRILSWALIWKILWHSVAFRGTKGLLSCGVRGGSDWDVVFNDNGTPVSGGGYNSPPPSDIVAAKAKQMGFAVALKPQVALNAVAANPRRVDG